jgi:hypothetical protein
MQWYNLRPQDAIMGIMSHAGLSGCQAFRPQSDVPKARKKTKTALCIVILHRCSVPSSIFLLGQSPMILRV